MIAVVGMRPQPTDYARQREPPQRDARVVLARGGRTLPCAPPCLEPWKFPLAVCKGVKSMAELICGEQNPAGIKIRERITNGLSLPDGLPKGRVTQQFRAAAPETTVSARLPARPWSGAV